MCYGYSGLRLVCSSGLCVLKRCNELATLHNQIRSEVDSTGLVNTYCAYQVLILKSHICLVNAHFGSNHEAKGTVSSEAGVPEAVTVSAEECSKDAYEKGWFVDMIRMEKNQENQQLASNFFIMPKHVSSICSARSR